MGSNDGSGVFANSTVGRCFEHGNSTYQCLNLCMDVCFLNFCITFWVTKYFLAIRPATLLNRDSPTQVLSCENCRRSKRSYFEGAFANNKFVCG